MVRDGSWKSVLRQTTPLSEDALTSVPRLFHQAFFPGIAALPPEIRQNIDAIRALNPGWEYRFYDGETAENFIRDHYGADMLGIYRKIDPEYYAARADLLRYLICYAHGGVYLDVKSGARKPFDAVLKVDDRFLLSQWNDLKDLAPDRTTHAAAHPELRHVPGFEYVQWFVISAPRHPFLEAVIDHILDGMDRYRPLSDGVGRKGVLRLTGPIAYTCAIEPLRATTEHRYADFEADLGLVFSIYGNPKQHRTAFGSHYSQKTRPVVRAGAFSALASRVWFGTVEPTRARVGNKLRRLRRVFAGQGGHSPR